jgi:hypothetical protein
VRSTDKYSESNGRAKLKNNAETRLYYHTKFVTVLIYLRVERDGKIEFKLHNTKSDLHRVSGFRPVSYVDTDSQKTEDAILMDAMYA